MDIVISSTAAPHYILDRAQLEVLMKARKNRPLLLIDIAVPRDIDPEIKYLENVYLYNIDDLQEIAADYLRQRQDEIARCRGRHSGQGARPAPVGPRPGSRPVPISPPVKLNPLFMPPILIATRGSALALAQANTVLAQCRRQFRHLNFELTIIKTTGDKLQTADPAAAAALATRALFTKELETALLQRRADLAVHSFKDLPTDLPEGLRLAAVAGMRADVRDVLVYRINNGFAPRMKLSDFPPGLTVATGSARRLTQLLAIRPDFLTVPIRGNVPTRLEKLAASTTFTPPFSPLPA